LLGVAVLIPNPDKDDLAAVFHGCFDEWAPSAADVKFKSLGKSFGISEVVACVSVSGIKM
jgi:hypothetical protein